MNIKIATVFLLIQTATLTLFANRDEYQKGFQAFKEKNFDTAKNHFCIATKNNNLHAVQSFLALGQIALIQKNHTLAEKYFKNAVEYNHYYQIGYSDMHTHISKIYDCHGLIDKKITHEKKAKLLSENKKN